MRGPRPRPIRIRFYEKVVVKPGCWGWRGSKALGYGRFYYKGKDDLAHRISWVIHRGPIPEGLFVLHKCDNPECTNPEHLFLGTQTTSKTCTPRADQGKYEDCLILEQNFLTKRYLP